MQVKNFSFKVTLILLNICLGSCFSLFPRYPLVASTLSPRLAASVRSDANYTWNNVAIGGMGFVTGLVIHPTAPNLIYARTDVGGLFRWNAQTSKWQPLMDMYGSANSNYYSVESVALDPAHPNVVYAAVGADTNQNNSVVLKSTNFGQTWKAISLKTVNGTNVRMGGNEDWRWEGERLMVDPNDSNIIYFGSRLDGLYKSTNAGESWSQVPSFPTTGIGSRLSFLVFDKTADSANSPSSKIYVGVAGSGVYQSTDAGRNWSLLTGGPASTLNPQQAVLASDGSLYVTYFAQSADPSGALWKYSQGKWVDVTPATGNNYTALTVDPTNPNIVMTAVYPLRPDGVYRSTTGGSDWQQVKLNVTAPAWWPSWHMYTFTGKLAINPKDPKQVWLTDGFGVMRTDDITQAPSKWTTVMSNLEELVTFVVKSPPLSSGVPLLSGVADMDGFRHESLTTFPTSNHDQAKFGDTTGMDFCETNPNFVARVGSFPGPGGREDSQVQAAASTDDGQTWNSFANPPADAVNGKIAVSATLQPNGKPILVWAPQGSAYPYRSLDGGATWLPVKGAPNQTTDQLWLPSQALASDRVDGNTFYLYKHGDQSGGGAFYRSTDGGETWLRTVTGLPDWYLHYVKAAPGMTGEVWLSVQGNQLYRSSDSGSTFTPLANVQKADNFAFGKAAPGRNNPTVFVYGIVNNTEGLFRSDDATSLQGAAAGATWVKISTNQQGLGEVTYLEGDGLRFGRVYVGTGGRGIFYGEPRP